MNGRITMSIASTRKVSTSLSYGRTTGGIYDTAGQNRSFVETIDTTNNVSVDSESDTGGNKYSRTEQPDENKFSDNFNAPTPSAESAGATAQAKPNLSISALLDNADETDTISPNHNVSIYGNNQAISENTEDNQLDNPYLKYFYENNTLIEDIDEFV